MAKVLLLVLGALCLASAVNLAAPAINHDLIHKINNNKKSTWKAGVNTRFNKHSISDVKRLLGVKKNGFVLPKKTFEVRKSLPSSYDVRTAWQSKCPSTNEIRDQSACGSCWAFGAVESITDRICMASNGAKQIHISAEDLNDCCDSCGMGCDGGDPGSAWAWWVQTGIVDGGNYNGTGCLPYTLPGCDHHVKGKLQPCPSQEYNTPQCTMQCVNGQNYPNQKIMGSQAYSIDSNINDIAQEIMTNGPVEAAFTVYEDFLAYKSGVYQYQSGDMLGGHAIKILGWGTWTDGVTPYWIVANSWNTDWGNNGYFLILRGQDECGIEDDICAGTPM